MSPFFQYIAIITHCSNFADGKIFPLGLVMDKGFFSEKNVDELYRLHHKFLIGVSFSTKLADKAVERNREEIVSHHNLIEVMGNELYAITETKHWKGSHRIYVHTYFDSFKAALDERKFNHRLLGWHDELSNNQTVTENQKYYDRFFIVKDTPKRGRKVEYNEEAIAIYYMPRLSLSAPLTISA